MKVQKYKIINIINSGTFGTVYSCSHNNTIYAIKETIDYLPLYHEAKIYKDLRNVNNISQLNDFFENAGKYYLVLNCYPENLIKYKYRTYNSQHYIGNLINITITLFETIKEIHNLGYVHRDLKPDNVCLNANMVPHIIDFGLSKKIIHNNIHMECVTLKSLIGCETFISINVKNLIEPSRRDDIESIIYIIAFMLIQSKFEVKFAQNKIDLLLLKDFLFNSTCTIEPNRGLITSLIQILTYCQKMTFTQKPNYEYIIKLLTT